MSAPPQSILRRILIRQAMDVLTGIVRWNRRRPAKKNTPCTFSNDFLDFFTERTHCFTSDGKNYFLNRRNGNLCAMVGHISNLDDVKSKYSIAGKDDVTIVEALYRASGLEGLSMLDGSFLLFIWDGNARKGLIFTDSFGYALPLFYVSHKDGLLFSTSLKHILRKFPFKRELNMDVVCDFLLYKIGSPTKGTLIKHVNKLLTEQYLLINHSRKSVTSRYYRRTMKKVPLEYAERNLIRSIRQSAMSSSHELRHKNVSCLFSSGYDSNLLLHFLASFKGLKVTAWTIDGGRTSEIPNARVLAKRYKNIKHKIKTVDSRRLDYLPDVVWRLEGVFHSDDVFLGFDYSRLVKSDSKIVFSGSSAEFLLDAKSASHPVLLKKNLLNELFYLKCILFNKGLFKQLGKKRFLLLRRYFGTSFPKLLLYDLNHYKAMKRLSMLCNGADLAVIRPFLNERTRILSKPLIKLNINRAFYEQEVKAVLGGDAARHLLNSGPVRTLEFMEANLDTIMKLFKTDFIRGLLAQEDIDRIAGNPLGNHTDVLCLLHLYLFNELFVSGKFDPMFDKPYFDRKLAYFLDNSS